MTEYTYSCFGEYLLPDLALPEQEIFHIGKYGQLRRKYLKNYRKIVYVNFLTSGILYKHLAEIDEQANDRLNCLIQQMATAQGITETLKVADQMAWVGAMNNIKACAEEIVLKEIVYE